MSEFRDSWLLGSCATEDRDSCDSRGTVRRVRLEPARLDLFRDDCETRCLAEEWIALSRN